MLSSKNFNNSTWSVMSFRTKLWMTRRIPILTKYCKTVWLRIKTMSCSQVQTKRSLGCLPLLSNQNSVIDFQSQSLKMLLGTWLNSFRISQVDFLQSWSSFYKMLINLLRSIWLENWKILFQRIWRKKSIMNNLKRLASSKIFKRPAKINLK